MFYWDFNDNSAGDSVDKLCWGFWWWTPLGIERTSLGRIFQLQLAEDNLLKLAGETYLCFTGDKLPESTGEYDSTPLGKPFLDCAGEMAPLGVSCIPPGNILIFWLGILRLSGMLFTLAGEYLYTPLGNIKTFWGYPTFLGLMVDQLCLGRVLLIVASLSGESFYYCLTLRGVKVSWSYSSAESTLYLVDRAACTVRTILIAPVSAGQEGLWGAW